MTAKWDEIDQCAQQWIREAGERIRASFAEKLTIETKANANDLVTNVDRDIEQFFAAQIRRRFPDHHLLGEEGFGDPLEALDGIVWIIDPIDGTMNFVHQQRHFAVSIGVFADGIGQLGYVYDVVVDELYWARKGQGVWLNGEPLSRLRPVPIAESVIAVNATWLMENRRLDHRPLVRLAKEARGTRSYGSAALELAYVAAGRLDAYLSPRLSPWDFAGGMVLIEEAGGVVTNLNGEPLDLLGPNSVLAAKPGVHEEILQRYLSR
ncbi:inositol monophosphatase family protein [Geobacillus sp. C56-T2]|uniref:inositol monophosphatase family protein n=1 Tax=Geobacillus sp. C56-T2 TaxID=600773 RepID=UPI0011A4F55E|nr:inositol monophosphatase family protein [Geobacillus sp. C56-T2]NNV05212.1 inositol monophosphatase family protein [Geobacillus sp. MMMUD3]TWG29929.1 myo-inositol-1(or 4)-monophosphatase [Geobacillus sp. C56-T2]